MMYQLPALFVRHSGWRFMNYGFTPLGSDGDALALDAGDEADRYCIRLYHHVAGAVDLRDLDVLEVGSGRGGGSYFVKSYLGPSQMVGLDYSEHAVLRLNVSVSGRGRPRAASR